MALEATLRIERVEELLIEQGETLKGILKVLQALLKLQTPAAQTPSIATPADCTTPREPGSSNNETPDAPATNVKIDRNYQWVYHNGKRLEIHGKSFLVFVYLYDHRDRRVKSEELQREFWKGADISCL